MGTPLALEVVHVDDPVPDGQHQQGVPIIQAAARLQLKAKTWHQERHFKLPKSSECKTVRLFLNQCEKVISGQQSSREGEKGRQRTGGGLGDRKGKGEDAGKER